MKNILISIRPQYVAKILNKEKTIEVRKHFPKKYVGWVYIYATKGKPYLYYYQGACRNEYVCSNKKVGGILNGKVVARFWCDKVEDYANGHKWSWEQGAPMWGACNDYEYILKDTCLTDDELRAYADDLAFSAIHITNLEIFDKPKEIREFETRHWNSKNPFERDNVYQLTRAPQSWCYIEV